MKIDSDKTSAYCCSFDIAIASKFSRVSLSSITGIKKCLEKVASLEEFKIGEIVVSSNLIRFTLVVPPNKTVSNYVYKIKKHLTDSLFEKNKIFSKPLFSTAFYCVSLAEKDNIDFFLSSLKPSYRSGKGELL